MPDEEKLEALRKSLAQAQRGEGGAPPEGGKRAARERPAAHERRSTHRRKRGKA